MISLKLPITINFPAVNGKRRKPVTLTSIDCTITYDNARKIVYARINGVGGLVMLWSGADYDKIGQFTDADVDAKLKELIAKDPEKFVQELVK